MPIATLNSNFSRAAATTSSPVEDLSVVNDSFVVASVLYRAEVLALSLPISDVVCAIVVSTLWVDDCRKQSTKIDSRRRIKRRATGDAIVHADLEVGFDSDWRARPIPCI